MLVDPYHDRYLDEKGNVIGVRYDGPVGDMRRTEYNLGVGGAERVHSNPFGDKYSVITPPGSTAHGGLEILTPPGSTKKGELKPITPPSFSPGGFEGALENLFLQNFIQERSKKLDRHGRPK